MYDITCKICGKKFKAKTTRRQLCSDECIKENNRIYSKNRYDLLVKNRPDKKVKEKGKDTIVDIAVKARQAGMSYGQYSAMLMLQNNKHF